MRADDVAVATVTLVRSDAEERLLRSVLQRLSTEMMRVAVSDGGSRPEFVEFLRGLRSFSVVPPAGSGLVGQVKASVRTATQFNAPYILYTEPDKQLFLEARVAAFIAGAPSSANVGVVLAARDDRSFATFPPFQRRTEGAFNAVCAGVVGVTGDYCYGPFLLNRALVPELDGVRDDLGWGWRPFIFATARRRGFEIVHHEGDFPCPVDQCVEDDGEQLHRLRQLRQNVEGLIDACRTNS
jgi:hypothetical protein